MYYNLTFFPITGLNEVFGDEIVHHFGGVSVQMKIFFICTILHLRFYQDEMVNEWLDWNVKM